MEQNQDQETEKSAVGKGTGKEAQSTGKTAESKAQGKGRKFEIDIFRGWCKSCGICAAFCPKECIRLDEDNSPRVSDESRCTGCGWCELHCPDFAISVREKGDAKAREQAV